MSKLDTFLSGGFSLKRVLVTVAVIEVVLAVALYVYYDRFHENFFNYPINSDGTVTVEGEPLLIGYGAALPSPWVFSEVGADTLRLNGLPFLPMREKDVTAGLAPGDRDRLLTIKSILGEAETAYKKADDKISGMENFGAVLEGYLGVFVEMVIVDRNGEQITVDFVDDLPPFTVTFLKEPHWIEPEGLRKQQHFEMIKDFIVWMEGNNDDAVFSFGPHHTQLLVGQGSRRDYTMVLAKLGHLEESSRSPVSEDSVRDSLGDEEYGRWRDLIMDYVSWRGMHASGDR